MRLLFYVDPLIENGRPYWKDNWGRDFCADLARALLTRGGWDFQIAVSEPVAEHLPTDLDWQVAVFAQEELYAPFGTADYLDVHAAWNDGTYTEAQLAHHVALLRSKLAGPPPDAVVTFRTVPFVEAAYPHAAVFCHEFSFFSRPPYPLTWCLDPMGNGPRSYIERNAERIVREFPLSNVRRLRLDAFRETLRDILVRTDPFSDIVRDHRKRFNHLLLLPLETSEFIGWRANSPFASQFRYLTHVLERTPRDVGVLVTEHPGHKNLTPDAVDYLRKKYPHFLCDDAFDAINSASQYLLLHADAVLSVTSSLGLLSAFWKKRIVALGSMYRTIASATTLDSLPGLLGSEPADLDALVYWMLAHYMLDTGYLHDPEWLDSFLRKGIARYRGEPASGHDFELIDEDEDRRFARLSAAIRPDVPEPRRILPYHHLSEALIALNQEKEHLSAQLRAASLANERAAAVFSWLPTHGIPTDGRLEIGELCTALGAMHTAERWIAEALMDDPDSPVAMNDLAIIAFERGEPEAAARLLERAVALKPDFGEAIANLEVVRGSLLSRRDHP